MDFHIKLFILVRKAHMRHNSMGKEKFMSFMPFMRFETMKFRPILNQLDQCDQTPTLVTLHNTNFNG